MAESSGTGAPGQGTGDHYFCHQCKLTIGTVQNFTCPRCGGGFLEKVEDQYREVESDEQPEFVIGGAGGTAEHGQMELGQLLQMMAPIFGGQGAGGINPAGPRPSGSRAGQGQEGPVPMEIGGFLQHLMERLGGEGVQVHMQFGGESPLGLHGNPGDYAWGPAGLDQIVTQLLNASESGPPPLNRDQIAAIPKVDVTEDHVERKVQCTTCMEFFEKGEKVLQLLCDHIFHADCIIPWLKKHNTCPICRKVLAENEPATTHPNTNATLDQIDELD